MKNKKDNNNLKNNQNLKIKKTIEYTRQIRVKKKDISTSTISF